MYIREIIFPGTWVNDRDQKVAAQKGSALRLLAESLADVAISLGMFDDAYVALRSPRDWSANHGRRRQLEQEFMAKAGFNRNVFPDRQKMEEILWQVEIAAKRERWARGELPSTYAHRLPFLHAKSFILALSRTRNLLDVMLAGPMAPAQLNGILAKFDSTVPHLKDIRDAIAHYDERTQRKGRWGKELELKPIDTGGIKAPGGVLALENLNGTQFGTTAASGHYREIDISAQSLDSAVKMVQDAIDCFPWKGPRQHLP